MKLLLTIFVSITAIVVAIYQQEITQFMRGNVLRNTTLNSLTSNLRLNYKSFSAMTNNTKFVGLPVIPPNDPSLNAKEPKPRSIRQVFEAREQAEGAGATVRRSIGTPKLRNFTPVSSPVVKNPFLVTLETYADLHIVLDA